MAIPGQPDFAASFGLIEPIDVFGNYAKGQTLAQASGGAAPPPQQAPVGVLASGGLPRVDAAGGPVDPLAAQSANAAAFQSREQAFAAQEARKAAIAEAMGQGSTAALSKLFVAYPDLATPYKEAYARLDEQEKKTALMQAGAAAAAIKNGEPQTAVLHLRDNAAAYRTAGRTEQADALDQMADQIEAHPETAQFAISGFGIVNGGKEWVEAQERVEQQPSALKAKEAEAAKAAAEASTAEQQAALATQAELAKIGKDEAQVARWEAETKDAADRLGLEWAKFARAKLEADREFARSGADLPAAAAKGRDDAVNAAIGASMSADTTNRLAGKFRELANDNTAKGALVRFFNTGMHGQLTEGLTDTFGIASDVGALKKQYRGVVNSEVLKNLPPGAASDTDVKLMREAFDSPNASFEQIANGLDALARTQERIRTTENFKAAWIQKNRGLGPSRVDNSVDGVDVEQGESFARALAKKLPGGDVPKSKTKFSADEFAQMDEAELQRIAAGG